MHSRVILTALTILSALLCTAPLMAAQDNAALKKKLHEYLGRKFYREKIMNTATSYALAQSEGCPQRNAMVSRLRYKIIERPVFEAKKLHPVKGSWFETVSVVQCREGYQLDITVIANGNGKMPDFIASPARDPSGR